MALENDRQLAERTLADTEYLAREIVSLRLTLEAMEKTIIDRDALRDELKHALEELDEERSR